MTISGGYLLPGATLLRDQDSGFFETYKGIIETDVGKTSAYVKLLSPKALANELVCTVLGKAAGLPVPDGYLVEVSVEDYPNSPFLVGQKLAHTLAYGSAALDAPSLARQFGRDDSHAFSSLLTTWSRWKAALLFDEWVSNADRHPGNFLVKGPDDVWLIDHSHAFRGPNWYITDLVPHASTKNLIAEHANRTLKLPERSQLLETADHVAAEYESLDIPGIVAASRAASLLGEGDLQAMQDFLISRVKALPQLVAKHIGIPRFPVLTGA
jgi:hypothetical protein